MPVKQGLIINGMIFKQAESIEIILKFSTHDFNTKFYAKFNKL